MTIDTQRFAAIVDDPDWIIYADKGFVAFPHDIQVGYIDGHWILTRPGTDNRIIWGPASKLVWQDKGISMPCGVVAGALAQALDDGDTKRVWTMRELLALIPAKKRTKRVNGRQR